MLSPRHAAIGALSLAALLTVPALALGEGPLPVTTPGLPVQPPAPPVTITPSDGGATVDAGVGETGAQVGIGPGGLSFGLRGSRSTPSSGGGATDSFPVSTPRDRPGNGSLVPALRGGAGGLVFAPVSSGGHAARKHRGAGRAGKQPGPGSTSARPDRNVAAEKEKGGGLHSPPFFEFVDRIPTAALAGLLALALIALAVWASWVRTRRRLDHNAFVDPITGIANAAAFESLLGSELERAKRFKRPLGLLVLEVSGHERAASGLLALRDQTLRDVTRGIQERIRSADTVARLGESRFAVISPEATAASVETMARALELRLEEFRVHVKVGVAERMAADLGPQDLLARAGSSLASPDPTPSSPSRVERSAVLRAA